MHFQTRRTTTDVGAFFELAVLDCFLILGFIISVGCVTIRQQTSRDVKGRQGTSKKVKEEMTEIPLNSESRVCTAF